MEQIENYKFLEKLALDLGATDARVIPIDGVVVEDRVRLRCLVGCPYYGKGLRCPPFTPSVGEFRKMVSDYKFAMVVKFNPSQTSKKILAKYDINLGDESERLSNQFNHIDELSAASDFSDTYKQILTDLLEIERAAFNKGYTFATAFFAGRCWLCEKCDVENGCRNPIMARFSSEAMGINLLKTAENANMVLKFGTKDISSTMSLLSIILID